MAPAEALLVSSSPAFYGLHDSTKIIFLACFYRKLLKKRRPHSEREPTIEYPTEHFVTRRVTPNTWLALTPKILWYELGIHQLEKINKCLTLTYSIYSPTDY